MLGDKVIAILAECAKMENRDLTKKDYSSETKNLLNQLNDIEEMTDVSVLNYTCEMVNIHQDENNRYLVEFENISKLAKAEECTIKQAVNKLCEHYDINVADTYVVIESVDKIMNQLKESQVCTESANAQIKAYGQEIVAGVFEEFNALIESGVKLLAKPSYGAARIF